MGEEQAYNWIDHWVLEYLPPSMDQWMELITVQNGYDYILKLMIERMKSQRDHPILHFSYRMREPKTGNIVMGDLF